MKIYKYTIRPNKVSFKVESKFLNFIIKLFVKKAQRKIIKNGHLPKNKPIETICDLYIDFNVKEQEDER